mgnify:CR=1 FL=1
MASPTFLAIGHVTRDLDDGACRVGGAAAYAALTAQRLGYAARVVTRAGADLAARLDALLPGVAVACGASRDTTTFRNTYVAGRREQWLLAVAEPIALADVPVAWRRSDIVLLAPVAGELGSDMLHLSARSLLGVSAQGWMRRRGEDGRVHKALWVDAGAALRWADAIVFSEEDVGGDWELVATYAAQARVLAVTEGARGATIFARGAATHVPAFPARAVDPTGAGDVFAAALLVCLRETGGPVAAARFASCAASFAVEDLGTAGVPTRQQVEERLRRASGPPASPTE